MQAEPIVSAQGQCLSGPLLLTHQRFGDDRGWFFESWNQRRFDAMVGEPVAFVQDNHSRSSQGVLRGLHYQLPAAPQAKLVRASVGRILDVVVDLRASSASYGQWAGVELSAENQQQLWVPEGFAHGFLTLSAVAEVQYKTRGYWSRDQERAIRWDDPALEIRWPLESLGSAALSLSEKDAQAPTLAEAQAAGEVFP